MKKYKHLLIANLDIILFFISLSIKILIYGRQIEENYFKLSTIVYPAIASVLIICSLFMQVRKKIRSKVLILLNLLLSIIIICDLNYFRYFKDIPSLSVLRNGVLLGPVKSSIGSLFKPTDLLFLVDIIVFSFVMRLIKSVNSDEARLTVRIGSFIVLFFAGCALDFIYIHKLSVDQPRLLTTMFNRVYIAKQLGIVNAHGIDVYNELHNELIRHTAISQDKEVAIKTFLESNSSQNTVKLNGTAKGKNLIMIQVEALQQFIINKSIDDIEITPNLNKWIKKSAYFNNFFYQVSSGGTSDAEFMSNNSIYPSPTGAAYYLYPNNEYNSLPKSLKNIGYTTAALHGFKSTFWNRDVMYKTVGFDNFYSERDFNIDSTIGLGLSDKSFLTQSIDKIKELQRPYYSFLITLSSHFPYDDQSGYGNFSVGKYENTLIGNYIRGIHYTDDAIGDFLDKLEKEGILDDSILVIYGDHNAIPKDEESELMDFVGGKSGSELDWQMQQKVPFLIHFPGDENSGTYETFGGEMDIYPTLINLFQLDDELVFGKDLFNTEDDRVIFRNGSFIDGTVYYDSPSNAYYDIKNDIKLEQSDTLKAEKEDISKQLDYSDEILKHDLLKKYNTEDN